MIILRFYIHLLLLFTCHALLAEDEGDDDSPDGPPKIGNFALPSSQQPAALFGFGGNIIDKDAVQVFFFADDFVGNTRTVVDMIPAVVYGITDDLSLFLTFPFTPIFQDRNCRSEGLQDFFAQVEYAVYNKKSPTYIDQATILGNVSFPTGSIHKQPNTGFGAPGFFVGATYYHTTIDWFMFTMQGAELTTAKHKTKIGNQYLYQFGLGRNVLSPEGWIYAWMFELDGQYSEKNRIKGKRDRNSGGNVIYATPSVWISSENFLLQFGVSIPLNQAYPGKQGKFNYALNLNTAWTFY